MHLPIINHQKQLLLSFLNNVLIFFLVKNDDLKDPQRNEPLKYVQLPNQFIFSHEVHGPGAEPFCVLIN
jgi:hypothetical protein